MYSSASPAEMYTASLIDSVVSFTNCCSQVAIYLFSLSFVQDDCTCRLAVRVTVTQNLLLSLLVLLYKCIGRSCLK